MWLLLSLISACILGIYDCAKKQAVTGNAVFPVFFFSTLSAAVCTIPIILFSFYFPEYAGNSPIYIAPQPWSMHILIIVKSIIVGTSWVLSYFGLKHLPITIAAPLRATAPFFTVCGAVLFFGERPLIIQWIGIACILFSYMMYSRTGRQAISGPTSVIWIVCMIFSAITGAISSGFDKFLLQHKGLPPLFVLSWFLFYCALIFGLFTLIFWLPHRTRFTAFTFKPAIVIVGILLVFADIVYMNALSHPEAQLALVSAIRRSNVLISFAGGTLLFHEGNSKEKCIPFAGIIIGLILLMGYPFKSTE